MATPSSITPASTLVGNVFRMINDLAEQGYYGAVEVKLADGVPTIIRASQTIKPEDYRTSRETSAYAVLGESDNEASVSGRSNS